MRPRQTSEQIRDPAPGYVATSVHLTTIAHEANAAQISVGWLIEQLGERSFGLTFFLIALFALVPGASAVMGVLIAWPAIQLILGHDAPILPGLFERRTIATDKLTFAVRLLTPRLRRVETLIRPRWHTVFRAARQLTGVLMLLLGLTLIFPFPFSHVVPALVIMLLALAYLEEDGIALLISLMAALMSLAITAAALWGAAETAGWLDRLWPA